MPTSSGVDPSVRRQRIVWLVWALCGLAVALAVSASVLQVLGPRPVAAPVLAQDALLVALEILCVIIGALISIHRPGNRIGGLLLAGALALSVFSFLENYFGYAARQPGVLPDLRAVAWVANGALLAGVGALVLMLLLYPTGMLPSRRWRPVAWALGGWGLVAVLLSTVQPTLVMAPTVSNPVGVQGSADRVVEQALAAAIIPLLLFLPAAVVSLIVRFGRARGQERQRLKWLLYAVALSAATSILNNLGVLGTWGGAIDNLVGLGIPVAIGIALLRYRLYDIDRLINRTLVYGLLTALLASVYAAVVLILGQVFGGIGNQPPSWAIAGATLAVAASVQPARRRIQQTVDRRFNRRRYHAARTVEAFSARLRDELDLDTLAAELLAVVDRTMEPAIASLWLRPPVERSPHSPYRSGDGHK
jgi:hypothetical protein